jgi:Redoxin
MTSHTIAPDLQISQWFNTPTPLDLAALKGRVVMLTAFQMLCPGCVAQSLPQAQRVRMVFAERDVAVIGLHTVFEHHSAMTPVSLAAFLHEYRIGFPVGVDRASEPGPIPATMRAYAMRGTPTTILIDREGYVRRTIFGHDDDLRLGAEIMALVRAPSAINHAGGSGAVCTPNGCT